MRRLFLFFLFIFPFGAAAQQRDSLREQKSLVSFGVGFMSGNVSVERFVSPRWSVCLGGGVRMNYLPSGSPYPKYRAYQSSSGPSYYDHSWDEYGQGWTSLFLAADVRYYFYRSPKSAKAFPRTGAYLGLKYIFTGKSFEKFEDRDFYVPPPPYASNTYVSRYNSIHKTGLVLGAQIFIGKRQGFLVGAEAGLGPTFNHNFSHAELTPFLNFRLGVAPGRF